MPSDVWTATCTRSRQQDDAVGSCPLQQPAREIADGPLPVNSRYEDQLQDCEMKKVSREMSRLAEQFAHIEVYGL